MEHDDGVAVWYLQDDKRQAGMTRQAVDMRSADFEVIIPLASLPEESRHIHLRDDGEAIALFRHDGELFALGNRCVHRGGSIGDGKVTGRTVTCPMHEWIFSLEDGRCIDNPEIGLRRYPVVVEDGIIKVNIENAQ